MKRQLTQQGWDGTFTWAKGVPAPTDVSDDTSQLGSFTPPSFAGFTRQNEAGGNGPTMGPSNGMPTNGSFSGSGTGFDGFGRQNE